MNYKNNNGNIIMSNASSNSVFSNTNENMTNANNNLRELNRVKADLKRVAREALRNSNSLNALVARIQDLGSNIHKQKAPVKRPISRKNALKIQRIIHPNKSMTRFKNIQNTNIRNKIRRNLTETSALFQYQ